MIFIVRLSDLLLILLSLSTLYQNSQSGVNQLFTAMALFFNGSCDDAPNTSNHEWDGIHDIVSHPSFVRINNKETLRLFLEREDVHEALEDFFDGDDHCHTRARALTKLFALASLDRPSSIFGS
jgi:hypothetical protein